MPNGISGGCTPGGMAVCTAPEKMPALRDKIDIMIQGAGRIRDMASALEERLFISNPTNGDENVQPCSADGQINYLASILNEVENTLSSVLSRV